jgi:hypothetical protein
MAGRRRRGVATLEAAVASVMIGLTAFLFLDRLYSDHISADVVKDQLVAKYWKQILL